MIAFLQVQYEDIFQYCDKLRENSFLLPSKKLTKMQESVDL